ncbi:amino acid adenylation domain-containing protein [Streptomyces albidoflavus]|uniref:amino acid adenylation domain-containing protein n=1 Tax=Streptomyces albidoflavus TaxID=1886 RepID=UPI0033293A95
MPTDRHVCPPTPEDGMLPELIRAHARRHPHREAVVAGHRRLSYAELSRRADALALLLRSHGVGRGSVVAVHLERSADVVVAVAAVLGAGAAYTVVEPATPVAHGTDALARLGADLVLAAPEHERDLAGAGLPVLVAPAGEAVPAGPGGEEYPPSPGAVADNDVAYVLYTSGSTGTPKGVMVTHANIRHYTVSLLDRLGITEPLRYAHVTTLGADLGNTCLFLALWTGGTLHLVDDATRRDPRGLLDHLRAERVDVLKTTPSHWNAMEQGFGDAPADSPVLRFLLLGGELLGVPQARRVLASGVTRVLVNHYGPTETTVGVAAHVLRGPAALDGLAPDARSVPIGTPLGATTLLLRTDDGRLAGRDAVGELLVAGPSVARGYRDAPEATRAAFAEDPALPGAGPVYRTGDRVRADADGVLEFLGRGDRQVKISGYRVELGHVEAGLRRLPRVAHAAALHRPGRRPALVAAVVLTGTPRREGDALRRELGPHLPAHMVPDRVVVLDAFPLNANGKTDHRALGALVEERLSDERRPVPEAALPTGDPLVAEVAHAWERALGHRAFGPDDAFHEAGGTSIDAIQVIAHLQAGGHQVAAARFLAEPTVSALARLIADGTAGSALAPGGPARPVEEDDTALSPAQQWFFERDFAAPDHWNQALLLDVAPTVRAEQLAAAVEDAVAPHPLLRTAFRDGPGGIRRVVTDPGPVFSRSALPAGGSAAVQAAIRDTAALRQAEISVRDGRLFKAHLFQGDGQAHLLLIAHHLAVDAVSWRILVGDLSRSYGVRLRGGVPDRPPADGFGAWATDLRARREQLREDLSYWDDLRRLPVLGRDDPAPDAPAGGPDGAANTEGGSRSVWFGLSRAETEALAESAGARTGGGTQDLLLAAFAQALAEADGRDELVVDVESHGRRSFHEAIEISRVVGWFTSTFPVRVAIAPGDVETTAKAVATALDRVPHLGIAYGLHAEGRRADLCFNYLGGFALPHGDELAPALSRYAVGPVRGDANDRVHDLKLTARTHEGRLVADVSYSPGRHTPERMAEICRATGRLLLRWAGLPRTEVAPVHERGSSTGLLAQVPEVFHTGPATAARREYTEVLLTGATGFIGAHLLHLLLTRTRAHVHCLVRAGDDAAARERLREAHDWYLPEEPLRAWEDRVSVHAADLGRPSFGLTEETLDGLRRRTDAVYHLASDTRLFGDRDSFERQNVAPVRDLIRLAATGRPKDLHYMSTLAVCGAGGPDGTVIFSEDSLNVGQSFLNEYERSKYRAEQLVREFADGGGGGFIYRSGNVTGHSVTGRFQRNGGDNRLVQMLRSCARLGRVPATGDQGVVLSPVDLVAEAMLALSLSTRVTGGTHHVDAHQEVAYTELFAAMREAGCTLEPTGARGFAALFGAALERGDVDETLSLAHFWAGRPARAVRYDHTRTRRALADLGVAFPVLDRAWLRRFFTDLVRRGELPSGTHNKEYA